MIVTTARAARLFFILAVIAVAAPLRDAAAATSPNDVTNSTIDDGTAECSAHAKTHGAGWPDAKTCGRSRQQPPTGRLYSQHYFGADAE